MAAKSALQATLVVSLLSSFSFADETLFDPALNYRTGEAPSSISAADVNDDGHIDLVVTNQISNTVSILTNLGNGLFNGKVDYITGPKPSSVFVADLDGDTDKDLTIVNSGNSTFSILKNNGDGTFAPRYSYITFCGPRSVFASDIDMDGDRDLVITVLGQCFCSSGDVVSIFKNDGIGGFTPDTSYSAGPGPTSILVSDLDNDGDVDIATANFAYLNRIPLYCFFVGNRSISIFRNNGNGAFSPKVNYTVDNYPSAITAFDADIDGDQDLAVTNEGSASVSILLNSQGIFSNKLNIPMGSRPSSICAADFDLDGDFDLAATDSASAIVSLLENNGDGTFGNGVDYGVRSNPIAVVTADFDGDGDKDVAVVNQGSNLVSVLTNHVDCPTKLGDLDHDCILTIEDIVPQLNCIFLNFGDCRLTLTDVNCSGAATPADVVVLLLAVFASQPLPCP